jgi:alkyldihydroxyacetonephosphate synthase
VLGQLVRDLRAAVGGEHVSTGAGELTAAAADWSWMSQLLRHHELALPTADVVVRPGTTAEVEAVVRIASDYRAPVVPRGGGSGTQGGTLALYGGIAVDLTRMNRIIELDETSLAVTVQAGANGAALEKDLNAVGLTLAHYPGSYHFGATIGGSIAARGSGVVSTKYGKAEDLAMQVEACPPGGDRTLPVPNHAAGPTCCRPHRLGGDARDHHRGHDAPRPAAPGRGSCPTVRSVRGGSRRPADRPGASCPPPCGCTTRPTAPS